MKSGLNAGVRSLPQAEMAAAVEPAAAARLAPAINCCRVSWPIITLASVLLESQFGAEPQAAVLARHDIEDRSDLDAGTIAVVATPIYRCSMRSKTRFRDRKLLKLADAS